VRRLVDDPDQGDPRSRVAAKILRTAPPLNDAAQRQRRIRLKLGSPSRRATMFRLRPVMVVLMTMLCMAGGSAMVNAGGGWRQARQRIESWVHGGTPATSRALPARRSIARAAVVPGSKTATATATATAPIIAQEAASPTAPVAVEPQARRSESKHRVASRVASRVADNDAPQPAQAVKRPANVPAQQPPNLEADLMLEAIQARQDGDLARADRLLTRYRTEFPDGVLQEEALALSIEAMAARNRRGAEQLARLYLQRYPDGRFRERVARGLRTTPR
jgi:hypothetical protein